MNNVANCLTVPWMDACVNGTFASGYRCAASVSQQLAEAKAIAIIRVVLRFLQNTNATERLPEHRKAVSISISCQVDVFQ